MDFGNADEKDALLLIQNSSKPHQTIRVVMDRDANCFRTEGLKLLFGVREIRIESADLLENLEEYAKVLSFLFETMSTAEDLHLPYGYQNIFEFGGRRYILRQEGDYESLSQTGDSPASV